MRRIWAICAKSAERVVNTFMRGTHPYGHITARKIAAGALKSETQTESRLMPLAQIAQKKQLENGRIL